MTNLRSPVRADGRDRRRGGGVAGAVEQVAGPFFGGTLPVRLVAWDGSAAGPPDGVIVHLRSPDALRYLVWAPGQLGVARAYVTGTLDIEGDFAAGLDRALAAVRHARALNGGLTVSPAAVGRGLRLLVSLGVARGPLPAPSTEARPSGRLHSRRRDAEVISHHYDLSNEFYSLLLDPHMAYSCAYWTDDDPAYGLADAQRDKLDLICRKLDLSPGSRLLDIGCGWGSLTVHAAKHYGASVTAVTVATEQADFVRRRLDDEGVGHLVDLRLSDYRDVIASAAPDSYDAVAVIEMAEHVGASGYPTFLSGLRRLLRDRGRLLVQAMSRDHRHPGGGPFIERYIAPDMNMRPVHATVDYIQSAGFEVRDVQAMREHYGRTIRAWHQEFERRFDDVVDLIGEEAARVWRIYLAGGALSFEQNRMGVDQILALRTDRDGKSGMAPTRIGWDRSGEELRGRI